MPETQGLPRPTRVAIGERWRDQKQGHTYVVTRVGKRKATFVRQTEKFTETATVWINRLLADPTWERVDA